MRRFLLIALLLLAACTTEEPEDTSQMVADQYVEANYAPKQPFTCEDCESFRYQIDGKYVVVKVREGNVVMDTVSST